MTVPLNVNGIIFDYPTTGDILWGDNATNWSSAVTNGMLQKTGGLFVLSSDVNFGPNFGLRAVHFGGLNTNATTGVFRLGNTEAVAWRNAGNTENVTLSLNTSDQLVYTTPLASVTIDLDGTVTAPEFVGTFSGTAPGLTDVVFLTGNQTINGVKTFIDAPQMPAPTMPNDAATKAYVDGLASGMATTVVSGTSQTAIKSTQYVLTNTGAATTLTLPASPADGDIVWVLNRTGRTDAVINRNGQLLMGVAENMTIDRLYVNTQLRFVATLGWFVS